MHGERSRTEQLRDDVELALKRYLGTDSFPTDQWPNVASNFAELIESTGRIGMASGYEDPDARTDAIQHFLAASGCFSLAIHDIVE